MFCLLFPGRSDNAQFFHLRRHFGLDGFLALHTGSGGFASVETAEDHAIFAGAGVRGLKSARIKGNKLSLYSLVLVISPVFAMLYSLTISLIMTFPVATIAPSAPQSSS